MTENHATIRLSVNGAAREIAADPWTRLLDVLRGHLRLTGTKEGCGEGECGACAVLVDGRLVNSCLIPVGQLHGAAVTTIEGLAPADAARLAPLQDAMLAEGGTQCGICTPGMMMAAYALLRHNPQPDLEEIRNALAGNLCRCTGYTGIYRAVQKACKALLDVAGGMSEGQGA
ncbi:MAG TPA: (2Fe-2S)-binding protein [Candidatus Sulfotelmatobacter sp.]|nr:(2Fe-2S)-binding protein [Candidatus Sulfotelmatobacter sp.]